MSTSRFLVFGDDEFLISKKAKEIVDATIPEAERDFGLEVVDGRAENVDAAVDIIRRCQESISTPAFLAERKLVWLKEANFLSDTVVGKSDRVKQPLGVMMEYIKSALPEGHSILVSAAKVDKRYAVYKLFKASGEIHEFSIPEQGYAVEKHASTQLGAFLAQSGLTMSSDVRAAFLERVGPDTRQLSAELEKMAVFLGERKAISLADVKAMTSASREALAWDLADAFGRRDLIEVLHLVGMLFAQKESAVGLVMVLEGRIRDLLIYREALDAGWLSSGGRGATWGTVPPDVDDLMQNAFGRDPRKAHPFRVKVLAEQARHFSMGELRRMQHEIARAHAKLVSSSLPPQLVFDLMLTRVLSKPKARAAARR